MYRASKRVGMLQAEIEALRKALFYNIHIVDRDDTVRRRMMAFMLKHGDLPNMQKARARRRCVEHS